MTAKIKELWRKYREIISYCIVGGMTTVVSLGSYYLCVLLFLDPERPVELQIANVISWVAAVTFAYVTNRTYVFQSRRSDWVREAAEFYSSRVLTLLMDMAVMFLLVTILHINDKIAKIVVQVVVMVANYVISKLLVFRKK